MIQAGKTLQQCSSMPMMMDTFDARILSSETGYKLIRTLNFLLRKVVMCMLLCIKFRSILTDDFEACTSPPVALGRTELILYGY
jgi:hypothetical protein